METILYDARLLPESLGPATVTLETLVSGLTGLEDVAFSALTFNEITDFLKGLESESPLLDLNWYGSDGIVQNDFLPEDAAAAAAASRVGLFSPAVAEAGSAGIASVKSRLAGVLDHEPRGNSYLIYDAFVAAALVTADDGSDDYAAKLNRALTEDVFITGTIQLDAAGDRMDCAFGFWRIVESNGSYAWVPAG